MMNQEKKLAFEKKIGKLFGLLLNQSVLNQETREEMEEILGEIGLSRDVLVDVMDDIRNTVSGLIAEAPYISSEQSDALSDDLGKLFDRLTDVDPEDAEDIVEYFEDKCSDIRQKIGTPDFPFQLKDIPGDVFEEEEGGRTTEIVKGVIKDIFGQFVDILPQDDKLRLDIKIEKAIDENIRRFSD